MLVVFDSYVNLCLYGTIKYFVLQRPSASMQPYSVLAR